MGKDPAFLFYDGDAAKDVSHMNRIERGCYFDFLQAQRKFGPMPLPTIKKILGRDFDECWNSLNMCLTYVNDMYFIAWLKDSTEKRQKYSEGRSKNRKGQKQAENKDLVSTYVEHMENENEIVIEDENTITTDKAKIEKSIFGDELFISDLKRMHKGKDLRVAWDQCWIYFSQLPNEMPVWMWRQKFSSWLISFKFDKTQPGQLVQ